MGNRPTIALLTDFGNQDSYVAEVKAVILSINSEVNLVDITHNTEPQNILQASMMLRRSFRFFPLGTIFVCVIDPEVGSERKVLYLETENYDFIAPDNGLLWMTASDLDVNRIVTLENYNYFLTSTPSTFEGRDKMAPVAAYASRGVEPTQFGPAKSGMIKLDLPQPKFEDGLLLGEILYFDRFGNAITNISFEDLMQHQTSNLPYVIHERNNIGHLVSTFSDASNGQPLAYFGSSGYLELAINNGSFENGLGARQGERIAVRYDKK